MMEFVPAARGLRHQQTGTTRFETLKATKECVINIPTVELAEKVVALRKRFGRTGGQVQGLWASRPWAAACVKAPAHRRVLCQSGMQGR